VCPLSDLAAQLLERRQHIKSNVNAVIATLDDHGARGVPVTAELAAAIQVICATLMKDQNPRIKSKGAELALAAMKYNLERMAQADKAGRLNAGEATENIGTPRGREELNRLLASDPAAMEAALALSEKLAAGGMPDALPSP